MPGVFFFVHERNLKEETTPYGCFQDKSDCILRTSCNRRKLSVLRKYWLLLLFPIFSSSLLPSLTSFFPILTLFLLPFHSNFPSSPPSLPLPSCALPPFPLTASLAVSHGSLLPHWLPKGSAGRGRHRPGAGGGSCLAKIHQKAWPGAWL